MAGRNAVPPGGVIALSTWVWLAIAAGFLGIGMMVMLGGLLVVVRALLWRPAARRADRSVPTPEPAARAVAPARPSGAPVAPASPPTPLAPRQSPTLVPASQPAGEAEDEWQEEVPTAVFRPSDYKDIEALMADADKYVANHRTRS